MERLCYWLIMLFGTPLAGSLAFSAQESVLLSFHGSDGANPLGGLVLDSMGNLYGTTWLGGRFNEGLLYQLAPAGGVWSETQLFSYNIHCSSNGICFSLTGTLPKADLSIDQQGSLYGTTSLGGNGGDGAVFRLSPPASSGSAWQETVVHSFADGPGGGIPLGGVFLTGEDGLIGTAGAGGPGGALGCGVVFRLSAPPSGTKWREQVLHSFGCAPDGANPQGNLIRGPEGQYYGTTFAGGTGNCFDGCGTVYQLTSPASAGAPWTETVLYSFTNTPDGVGPWAGLAQDAAGNLYGTTYRGGDFTTGCSGVGCGTVFELSPPSAPGGAWTETVLYSFMGKSDGGIPLAALAIDGQGNLYGTASEGGIGNCSSGGGCGVVFKLTNSAGVWTETVLHSFTGTPDGGHPQSDLTLHNGVLYGTTFSGGDRNLGTIFSVAP